jgi:hypothetical protein
MKLFLLGVFGAFTLLALFFNFGTDFRNGSASAASTPQPTSGPVPTVDTRVRTLYYYLNMAIENMEMSNKFTMLEHINGASYQVVYVGFQPENGAPTTLQINTRCECAGNAECCNPMHTFVITMQAMDEVIHNPTYGPLNTNVMPSSLTAMEVQCFDHTNFSGKMTMPWSDVVSFFQGSLDAFQLWSEVTPSANP